MILFKLSDDFMLLLRKRIYPLSFVFSFSLIQSGSSFGLSDTIFSIFYDSHEILGHFRIFNIFQQTLSKRLLPISHKDERFTSEFVCVCVCL